MIIFTSKVFCQDFFYSHYNCKVFKKKNYYEFLSVILEIFDLQVQTAIWQAMIPIRDNNSVLQSIILFVSGKNAKLLDKGPH